MATIRHAGPNDASAIAALWNPVIRDTVATFNSVEKSPEEIAALIAAGPGTFWLAEDEALLGFARFAQFRAGAGYVHSFEHTIVLAPHAQGKGLGRLLMARLCEAARAAGGHVLVAGISGENAAGLAFHAAMGFDAVGRLPEVGRKFGRWFDLVLMQRRL